MINKNNMDLTATEVSNLWASYMNNSMQSRFIEYFSIIIEDLEGKKILNKMLETSKQDMDRIEKIFKTEGLTIPYGFTEDDVRIDAKRVICDSFIIAFCYDFTLLTIGSHSSAILDTTREDIRRYFKDAVDNTILFQNDLISLMLSKGIYQKHPQVAIDKDIEIIRSKKYIKGILDKERSLNVAEIASLVRIIYRGHFSKMVFVAFSKLTSHNKLKDHFEEGAKEIQKVLDSLSPLLGEENIPISSTEDFKIFDTDISPFSDKLMIFFINTCIGFHCFTMITQALTATFRSDVILKIGKISKDMGMYYKDGMKIMIKNQWIEAPPKPINSNI